MPRDHRLYLSDILTFAELIDQALSARSLEELRTDRHLQAAIERYLETIGEAVKRVPDEIKTAYPSARWRKAASMCDILAHDYPAIVVEVIWDTAMQDVPELAALVRKIMSDSTQ